MTPLFVYKGEQVSINLDQKTKFFLGIFVFGGIGLSGYSLYRLISSFSFLFFVSLWIGLFISIGYGLLWNMIYKYVTNPTIMEVYPTFFHLRKFNEQRKVYEDQNFSIQEIEFIIERRLEPYRGSVYLVPALHLFDKVREYSLELFFDGDENLSQFLTVINNIGGVIRYLPYHLDYCSKEEKHQAFREEAQIISFSGDIADYVPRYQEAFFYSEQLEYKNVISKKRKGER